jgi:glucose/arabinose dehydrogenase
MMPYRKLSLSLALTLFGASAIIACGDDSANGGSGGSAGTQNPTVTGQTNGTNANTTGTNANNSTGNNTNTTNTTGSGGAAPVCDAPGGQIPALKLTEVADGLESPVFLTSPPGDQRMFVVELDGVIKVIENGQVLGTPFLDIASTVVSNEYQGDERGLLGMAFHPNYAQNGRFFLYYTSDATGGNAVYEYSVSGDPNVANGSPVATLVETQESAANHNGGMIAFDRDGFLLVGVGDNGAGGTPENAQNDGTLSGKILRIDVDNPATPPAGNLTGLIWDKGVRNPWRFSVDTCNGDMYLGDVGQNAVEEVDVEPYTQGKRNYGWPIMEGNDCYEGGGCNMAGLTLPVTTYSHNDGNSITGGFVYRGAAIPALQGVYFYGDFGTNRVWTFRWDGLNATEQEERTSDLDQLATFAGLSSFGQDAGGNVYLVDIGGSVYRVDAE